MNDTITDNRRIILVDDHEPIHNDFRDILISPKTSSRKLDELESSFFGKAVVTSLVLPEYELDSAFQGQEAYKRVKQAVRNDLPYALGFIDVRMPPGWDGIETIQKIWDVDPHVQIVICTAYADYTWDEMFRRFGATDKLVFLRKPFDHTEVRQLASSLTEKWNLGYKSRLKMDDLEAQVKQRTEKLEATVKKLEKTLEKTETLSGLIPICAGCKKIRDDKGFWDEVEAYIGKHSPAEFSHSICPECMKKYYPDM